MLVVLKIGSSVLRGEEKVSEEVIEGICRAVSQWINKNRSENRIVIVSSGAILLGMMELGVKSFFREIRRIQALCAVGQPKLMSVWNEHFSRFGFKTAQILLTHEDFESQKRMDSIKGVFQELLKIPVIPIVNENDTISTEEIRLGDNDFLSAYLSIVLSAQKFIVATDVDGIIDENMNVIKVIHPQKFLKEVKILDAEKLGVKKKVFAGGVSSKISALKIVSDFGVEGYVINGKNPENVEKVLNGENPGTKVIPDKRYKRKKIWIGSILRNKGTVEVDSGAYKAILSGKSLLPSGIISVKGDFIRGDLVEIVCNGKAFARGITNYSAVEINLIKGRKTSDIYGILGYKKEDEVIHRDNMFLKIDG